MNKNIVKKPTFTKLIMVRTSTKSSRVRTSIEVQNNVLFTRNNVILDMVEKMTNNPFIYNDEEMEDTCILSKNKEIAMLYAIVILACILYIIICDRMNKDEP